MKIVDKLIGCALALIVRGAVCFLKITQKKP